MGEKHQANIGWSSERNPEELGKWSILNQSIGLDLVWYQEIKKGAQERNN